MTKCIAAFLLICVLGCSSSSGTKSSATTADGNVITTFDDPKNGIRLTYPGNWEEQSLGVMKPKGTVIVLVAPSGAGATTMPPTISVVAQEALNEDLDAMVESVKSKASKQLDDFKLIESGAATLGGKPARRAVYTGRKLGVSLEVLNVMTIHNNRRFAVTYSADPDLFETHRAAVERVIESFQLKTSSKG